MSNPSEQSLIVPINVQALSCNDMGTESMGPFLDYSLLPSIIGVPIGEAPISAQVVKDPFKTPVSLKNGVYLHWSLPSALTQAPSNRSNENARPVPDTWLVTRFIGGVVKVPSIESWIIESNYYSDTANKENGLDSIAIPGNLSDLSAPGASTCYYLGRQMLFENWANSGSYENTYLDPLTAFGHGLAHFSGYYPNCSSVFGAADAFSGSNADDTEYSCSYLVVGWFRNYQQNDPASIYKLQDLLKTYNWNLKSVPPDQLPENVARTLYVGRVSGVQYPDQNTTPKSDPSQIAIGASTTSAVSALVANVVGQDPAEVEAVEKIVHAIQYGREDWLDQLDGISELEDLFHWASFAAEAPGTITTIKSLSQSDDALAPPLPESVAVKYYALYQTQLELLAKRREGDSMLQQLFLDWQNYIQKAASGSSSDVLDPMISAIGIPDSSTGFNLSSKSDYATAMACYQAVVSLKAQSETQIGDLNNALAEAKLSEIYTLKESSENPFYHPQDPAVAFWGDVFESPDRTDAGVALDVRLSNQLPTALTLCGSIFNTADQSVDVSKLIIPDFTNVTQSSFPAQAVMTAIATEAVLIDPNQVANILQATQQATATDSEISVLKEELSKVFGDKTSTLLTYSDSDGALELPDAISNNAWNKNPWLPLFLAWEISYAPFPDSPAQENYTSDAISSRFRLNADETELVLNSASAIDGTNHNTYTGIGFINPNHGYILANTISDFIKDHPKNEDNDELNEAVTDLKSKPVFTATLDNLTNQLLQLSNAPQLTPVDVVNDKPGTSYYTFTQNTGKVLRSNGSLSGKPHTALGLAQLNDPTSFSGFSPIRAGDAWISKLYVVDAFGQQRDLIGDGVSQTLFTDSDLAPPSPLPANTGKANFWLPPRLAQSSRLNFNWVSPYSTQETTYIENETQPVSNPIRGWIQINLLNHGLLTYTSSGDSLVEIYSKENALFYRTIPNSILTSDICAPTGPIDATFFRALNTVHVDSEFIGFLENLSKVAFSSEGSFSLWLEDLNERNSLIVSKNGTLDPATAAIKGRPLAICRVALTMELSGSPFADQSPQAFTQFVDSQEHLTKGVSDVEFPVRLGDITRFNDGTFGYFKTASDSEESKFFIALDKTSPGAAWESISEAGFTVNANQIANGTPLEVTMLLDPTLPTHTISGILPSHALSIPLSYYQEAMSKMNFVSLAAPVLSPDPALEQSLLATQPRVGTGDWEWIEANESADDWQKPVPIKQIPPDVYEPGHPLTLREGWLSLNTKTGEEKTEETPS